MSNRTDNTASYASSSDLLSFIRRLPGSTKSNKLTVADTSTTPAFNAANVLKWLGGADTLDAAEGTGNDRVYGGTDTCQTDAGDTKLNCP